MNIFQGLMATIGTVGVVAGATVGIGSAVSPVFRKDLNSTFGVVSESEFNDLKSENETLKVDNADLLKQIGILNEDIANKISLINTKNTEIDSLNVTISALTNEKELLTTQLNSSNARIAELESAAELNAEELATEKANVADLQTRLNSVQEELTVAQATITGLESEVSTLNTQLAEAQARIIELQAENEELRKQIDSLMPAATNASMFTFSENSITGFSDVGLEQYNAGNLTELVFPASYSLGEVIDSEKTFTDYYSFYDYCYSHEEVFPFNLYEIELNSIDDIESNRSTLQSKSSFTVPVKKQLYIDGETYSVNTIARQAFQSFDKLVKVTVPNHISVIDVDAFAFCSSLVEIELYNGLQELKGLRQCSSLKSINIPKSVVTIGYDTFFYCSSLEEINVADGNSKYSSDNGVLFEDNTTLLTYPSAKAGSSYVVPETVIEITGSAFYGSQLESIILPSSLTQIYSNTFSNCLNLKSIEIPDSVTNMEPSVFVGCANLETVKLPVNLGYIHQKMFQDCIKLKSINIPATVESIQMSAFSGCISLENIVLPEGVIGIKNDAFAGCSALKTIVIPKTVTNLGYRVFKNCTNLETIYYTGTESEWGLISISSQNTELTNVQKVYNYSVV